MSAAKRIRTAAKTILAHPAIWKLTAPLRRQGLFVLTYHRVANGEPRFQHIPRQVFEAQMRWLQANCSVIGPGAVRTSVAAPDPQRPPVLVTFDDGYRDFHDNAWPILNQLQIPAVMFLPTRFVDDGTPFWWDLLDAALHDTSVQEAPDPHTPGRSIALTDRATRRAYGRLWKAELKKVAYPDRSPLLDRALAALGFSRDSVSVTRQVMTWDEVRDTMPLVTPAAHTHNHPLMPCLDESQLRAEVTTCARRIEMETGRRPVAFAYPSGASTGLARRIVGDAGFDLGFSTVEGVNGPDPEWLALRRYHAPPTVEGLATLMAGWAGHG